MEKDYPWESKRTQKEFMQTDPTPTRFSYGLSENASDILQI